MLWFENVGLRMSLHLISIRRRMGGRRWAKSRLGLSARGWAGQKGRPKREMDGDNGLGSHGTVGCRRRGRWVSLHRR